MVDVLTRKGRPAINIKRHLWAEDLMKGFDHPDADFPAEFRQWIEWAHTQTSMWDYGALLWTAEQQARDYMWGIAEDDAHWLFEGNVAIWQEGRSGGWLVVDGLGDIDGSFDNLQTEQAWQQYQEGIREMIEDTLLECLTLRFACELWQSWVAKLQEAL